MKRDEIDNVSEERMTMTFNQTTIKIKLSFRWGFQRALTYEIAGLTFSFGGLDAVEPYRGTFPNYKTRARTIQLIINLMTDS